MKHTPELLLIVIAGPTASGKTGLSTELAVRLRTEIISADSRQFYKELNIGVARPTPEQLARVPHHFVGCLSVSDYYNASMFEFQALDILEKLFKKYPAVIMTGGSGLYIDAVCHGIDDLPRINQEIRNEILNLWKEKGIEFLREQLRQADPSFYSTADIRNPKRVLKALEVFRQTGRPYSSFLTGTPKKRPFRILKIALDLPRDILYDRINARVDEMLARGLMEEAQSLLPFRHLNALNTVGYKELFAFFEHQYDLNEAITLIKRNTRRYARRQLTWFRNDPEYGWFSPSEPEKIWKRIQQNL